MPSWPGPSLRPITGTELDVMIAMQFKRFQPLFESLHRFDVSALLIAVF
jgi:hypothetical protein